MRFYFSKAAREVPTLNVIFRTPVADDNVKAVRHVHKCGVVITVVIRRSWSLFTSFAFSNAT